MAPLALIYEAGTAWRLSRGTPYRAGVPVICVGNLNAGGTGKTPAVIALADRLAALNQRPHAVSRGYGGVLTGPTRVEPATHHAAETGDEPLLLAAFLPTWVAQDRAAGAHAAVAAGATSILLDDGFQNPTLAKDLSIVVVDAEIGFGNGRVVPAGPLREPVESGLSRADIIVSVGDRAAQDRFAALWSGRIQCPLVTARLIPLRTGMDWTGLRALAFAGIGRPEKFFRTLRGLGTDLVRVEALGDHQALTLPLMKRLEIEAEALGAQLVTTEKDAVRLPKAFRQKVLTLPVRLAFDEPNRLDTALSALFDA